MESTTGCKSIALEQRSGISIACHIQDEFGDGGLDGVSTEGGDAHRSHLK